MRSDSRLWFQALRPGHNCHLIKKNTWDKTVILDSNLFCYNGWQWVQSKWWKYHLSTGLEGMAYFPKYWGKRPDNTDKWILKKCDFDILYFLILVFLSLKLVTKWYLTPSQTLNQPAWQINLGNTSIDKEFSMKNIFNTH